MFRQTKREVCCEFHRREGEFLLVNEAARAAQVPITSMCRWVQIGSFPDSGKRKRTPITTREEGGLIYMWSTDAVLISCRFHKTLNDAPLCGYIGYRGEDRDAAEVVLQSRITHSLSEYPSNVHFSTTEVAAFLQTKRSTVAKWAKAAAGPGGQELEAVCDTVFHRYYISAGSVQSLTAACKLTM